MKRLFTFLAAIVCTLSIYSQGVKFSWQGLSLVHPSNYKITDKEYDGETYDFCCEINDKDISMINFSILKNDLIAMLSQEDAIEASKEGIDEALVELRKAYTSINIGEKKVNRNHRYAYVYRTFTGNLLGTHLYGKVIVMAHGDKYVVMMLQAESQNYLNTLNEIVNTIRIE